MSPAGSTVLGNVLVQGVGQVADAVDIAPVKIVRQMRRLHILMRQGTRVVVVDGIVADLRRVLERRLGKAGGTTNVQRPSEKDRDNGWGICIFFQAFLLNVSFCATHLDLTAVGTFHKGKEKDRGNKELHGMLVDRQRRGTTQRLCHAH